MHARGTKAATQTTNRLRRFSRHSNIGNGHRPVFSTTVIPHHLSHKNIRNDYVARISNVTVNDSTRGLRQQAEYQIPQPTWSVQDLGLSFTHVPISEHEFERLSHLVLIDVFGNNKYCDDRLYALKQDLGNMLHMIQHVTEQNWKKATKEGVPKTREKDDSTRCSTIYDFVRGSSSVPFRKGIEEDPLQAQDAAQSQDVGEQFLQSNTIRRGGHKYFAIKTNKGHSNSTLK